VPDLCLRPARLTRTFLDGHRISQVPPFRLFLVVVVLMFLVAGLGGHTNVVVQPVKADSSSPIARFFAVPRRSPFQVWLAARMQAVAKNPERFGTSLTTWAQRLVFLALPISALLLGTMFFWRRGIYMFDHLIFSMHSLSFQGMLLTISMLAMNLNGLFGWLLLIAPVHLFAHLKGTYALGVFGTLVRMVVLFLGSLIGLIFALSCLVVIGLFEVAP